MKADQWQTVGDIHQRGCYIPIGQWEFIIIGDINVKKYTEITSILFVKKLLF